MSKQSKKFMFKSMCSLNFVDRLYIAYRDQNLLSIPLAILNLSMASNSFTCVGIIFQILGPRYLTLSELRLTVLTVRTSKSVQFLSYTGFHALVLTFHSC